MEEKRELPIVGKTYWYCGKVGLSRNNSKFKFILKPIEVKVHRIDSSNVIVEPLVNSSIFNNRCSVYLDNHDTESHNYWENWIFETKEEAIKEFNKNLDNLKDLLWREYDTISSKIEEKKISV